jgi:hypothetical protein
MVLGPGGGGARQKEEGETGELLQQQHAKTEGASK